MCVCVDFARRDLGTCKHLEAAWIWLSDHPQPLPVRPDQGSRSLWMKVERTSPSGQTGADLRKRGEVLYLAVGA